jgi:hypothetical protein
MKYLQSSTRKLQSVYYEYVLYLVAHVNILLVILVCKEKEVEKH